MIYAINKSIYNAFIQYKTECTLFGSNLMGYCMNIGQCFAFGCIVVGIVDKDNESVQKR